MKAIGKNLIVKTSKQGISETKGGLFLAEKQREDIRYTEGVIVSAGSDITGIKEKEIVGKNIQELLDNECFNSAVSLLVIEQKKKISSLSTINKNNKKVLITGNPFFNESGETLLPVPGYKTPEQLELYLKLFLNNDHEKINTKEQWDLYQKDFVSEFKG